MLKFKIPNNILIFIFNNKDHVKVMLKNKLNNNLNNFVIDRNIKLRIKNNFIYFYYLPSYKKYIKTIFTIFTNLIYDLLFLKFEVAYVKGAGLKISLSNNKRFLLLLLGYSHIFYFRIPYLIFINEIDTKKTFIKVSSLNRQILYEFLYKLKKLKKEDRYKGKGLFFSGKKIFLKKAKSLGKK